MKWLGFVGAVLLAAFIITGCGQGTSSQNTSQSGGSTAERERALDERERALVFAANEQAAMKRCQAYCEAQEIYHRTDYKREGVLQYAQTLKELAVLELIDQAFAKAEGNPGQGVPVAGYCFKVLKAQAANAYGGKKKSYLEDGKMTLGYALVGYPSQYGISGRDTLVISGSGRCFQRIWVRIRRKLLSG
ncbi:MAG: DUF2950 family protein [Planctomycetota bacterium]